MGRSPAKAQQVFNLDKAHPTFVTEKLKSESSQLEEVHLRILKSLILDSVLRVTSHLPQKSRSSYICHKLTKSKY